MNAGVEWLPDTGGRSDDGQEGTINREKSIQGTLSELCKVWSKRYDEYVKLVL